jgi:hypothetical protein
MTGHGDTGKQQGQNGPTLRFEDEEHLPHTKPEAQYHIADDTKHKLNIYQWPDNELANNIAYKVSFLFIYSKPY